MDSNLDINRKKKVMYSLAAPEKMATRISGNKEKQVYRSKFMRDRDRVLYSKAFRRLAGKTQVYLSGIDDHKRTRLTHTLEVSQIARTLASNLSLNVDLTEAIALGHDIGHTPYGHSGERILHEIMVPNSKNEVPDCPLNCDADVCTYDALTGFKHNLQSIQTAIISEKYYKEYGLDLTNFTLFGIMFHSDAEYGSNKIINHNKLGFYDKFIEYCKTNSGFAWSFEAFIVREADEIAQRHHDLEDAIRGNLITKEETCRLIMDCFKEFLTPQNRRTVKVLYKENDEYFTSNISRILVDLLVRKLLTSSIYNMNLLIQNENLNVDRFQEFIANHKPEEVMGIISYEKNGIEDGFELKLQEFKEKISETVISSYEIQSADSKGRYIIKKLFQAYYKTPQQLPNHCIIEYFVEIGEYKSYLAAQENINKVGMGHLRKKFVKSISRDEYSNEQKIKLMRVICNYIAGMTDSYALKMYQELYS